MSWKTKRDTVVHFAKMKQEIWYLKPNYGPILVHFLLDCMEICRTCTQTLRVARRELN